MTTRSEKDIKRLSYYRRTPIIRISKTSLFYRILKIIFISIQILFWSGVIVMGIVGLILLFYIYFS